MKAIAPVWSEPSPRAFERLEGTLRCDVAVIGAGLTGLSAALHLLRREPGATVVVLEAAQVGAGASGRSTGMFGPGVGQSFASLVKRLGLETAAELYRATLRAVGALGALVNEEKIDCELLRSGQLVVARNGASRSRLERVGGLLASAQLPGALLDDHALARRLRLEPASGEGPAALWLPDAGTLHPGKLVAGLAGAVIARGGRIFEGARVHSVGHEQPVRLALEGAEVIADQVVIATAGYSGDLGVLRGRVMPVHLQAMVTEPLDGEQKAALGWAQREGVLDARRLFSYFRLTCDDRVVFGGGAPRYRFGAATGEQPAPRALDALEHELTQLLPSGARPRVSGGWTGVIGYVLDALPLIGRWRENPAVVHAVGWCGHGVALSVASGAHVTELLRGDRAASTLAWQRSAAPYVPIEPLRWLSFQAAVGAMSWLDGLEARRTA
jgi:gamma-glutamylputrescine oxidase